jgi:hypothetical protein
LSQKWIGLLVAAGIVAALVLATRQEASIECTVCIDYAGRSACRAASGATQEATVRGATVSACSVLSDGVTRGIECDRTPPRSIECTGD